MALDASHTSDGYVMLRYSGSNEKVKVQVTLPEGTEYTYPVTASEDYFVYPLPGGNGTYKITLLESVSVEDNLYAVSFTQDLDVQISDEFSPFLYPNFYVNFNSDSACVKKGEELDYVKASGLLFDDFRGGKIGRVTLEWAEQEKSE